MSFDLFEFYRFILAALVSTYTIARFVAAIWWWQGLGAGGSRGGAFLRRYVVVQLLRLRVWRFAWDLATIAGLVVILVIVIRSHRH
ncbi:MAG: hypothetical protein ACE5E6_03025 [Phycisphaerae bacterium]